MPIARFLVTIAAGGVAYGAVSETTSASSSSDTSTQVLIAKAKKPTASKTTAKSPASTFQEAANVFFDAYKAGDRTRALTVSTKKAVDKLRWNPGTGENPTLSLTCNGPADCFIYYEGGGINLTIKGSAAAGYRVVDVRPVAD